jgi:hypothetical protein
VREGWAKSRSDDPLRIDRDGQAWKVRGAGASEGGHEHRFGGAGQHGAPENHGVGLRVLPEPLADALGHAPNGIDIQLTVVPAGRPDADQGQVGPGDPLFGRGGGPQTAGRDDLGQQLAQPWLDEGGGPPIDHGHLVRVDVHADHLVAGLGQTGSRDTADIAEPKDANAHAAPRPPRNDFRTAG